MTESDLELIRHLTVSVQEQSRSLYQVRGVVSSVHERQEAFIQAHAAFVDAVETRADVHSQRIDETAAQIAAWKAQARIVIGVASFVGFGGLVSMLAVLSKLSGH